jgi:hypothetical protein
MRPCISIQAQERCDVSSFWSAFAIWQIGMVCMGDTEQKAKEYYDKVIYVLDNECKA